MKSTHSAYSKMYLVTPSVYEKLLHCLDNADAKMTKDSNVEKHFATTQTPAEKEIQTLNLESFNEPPETLQEEIVTHPETVQVPPAIYGSEFDEQQQQQQEEQQQQQQVVGEKIPVPQYEIVNNPLKQSCATQSTDTETVVPKANLIYNPNWKITNVAGKKNVKVSTPTFHPYGPPGDRTKMPKQATDLQCPVCYKFFDRKWSLTR